MAKRNSRSSLHCSVSLYSGVHLKRKTSNKSCNSNNNNNINNNVCMHTRFAALSKMCEPYSMQRCPTTTSARAEELHTSKQCKKNQRTPYRSSWQESIIRTKKGLALRTSITAQMQSFTANPVPSGKIVRERHTCIRVPPRAGPGRRCCGL